VAPYYNKPPQEGLYAHFEAIAESTKLPIVLYSIPGRTGVTIETDTMVRLAENHANIVGLKAAGGAPDVERTAHLLGRMREISRPDFTVLSGDDSLTLPFMRAGASGVISVASNIIPTEVSEMVRAQAGGDTTRADAINKRYARLFGAEAGLFIGGNPASVKAAMEMLGRISSGAMRLPLVPISDEKRAILRETLHNCGLLRRPALRPVEEFATQ
jgi:4-hydroxy-tetrahydrodipicolinate synthase